MELISCIVGRKGSGKTKQLIEMVNTAVNEEHGSVICIEPDKKLTHDINRHCRLIETNQFELAGYDGFFGFICGLYAQNYDITSIFIDNLYKIVKSSDEAEVEAFFVKLAKFSTETGIKFIITISVETDELPESVMKYVA
jgi:energy-coupling factor transporter ATP-binding protein EcfA2